MKKLIFLIFILIEIIYTFLINYNYELAPVNSLIYLEGNSSREEVVANEDDNETEIDLSKYQAYYGIFEGIIDLSIPYKAGYEFLGWYTSDGVRVTDENGKVINKDFNIDNNGQTISGSGRLDTDIHLVAHFNKIDDVVTERLEFDQKRIKVSDKDKVIYDLSLKTSKNDILSMIDTNANIKFLDSKDIIVDDNNVKTGYKLRVTFSTRVIEYKLSVKGDVLGEGKLSRDGAKKIGRHILEKDVIDGEEFLMAADYNGDGRIKMNDVIKILKEMG